MGNINKDRVEENQIKSKEIRVKGFIVKANVFIPCTSSTTHVAESSLGVTYFTVIPHGCHCLQREN